MERFKIQDLTMKKELNEHEMEKVLGGCTEPDASEKKRLEEKYGPFWRWIVVH